MGVTVTSKMILTMERGLSIIIERGLTTINNKQKDKILRLGTMAVAGRKGAIIKKEVHIKKVCSLLTMER